MLRFKFSKEASGDFHLSLSPSFLCFITPRVCLRKKKNALPTRYVFSSIRPLVATVLDVIAIVYQGSQATGLSRRLHPRGCLSVIVSYWFIVFANTDTWHCGFIWCPLIPASGSLNFLSRMRSVVNTDFSVPPLSLYCTVAGLSLCC